MGIIYFEGMRYIYVNWIRILDNNGINIDS